MAFLVDVARRYAAALPPALRAFVALLCPRRGGPHHGCHLAGVEEDTPARGGRPAGERVAKLSDLPISYRRTKPGRLFDGLANTLGPLDSEFKSRLRACIENPTNETWERAYAILLQPSVTLWMAVAHVDPTFPRKGPGQDARGRRNPWPRVPDTLTLVRAIRFAASGRHSVVRLRALLAQPPDCP